MTQVSVLLWRSSTMAANFKLLFNQPEEEIDIESFKRFSLFSFRLAFVDFRPLPEGASRKEKLEYFARDFYHKICIYSWCVALVSKIILVFNFSNVIDALPAILDVVTYFLNVFKMVHTVLRKRAIWKLFQDMEPLFKRRVDDNKKYGVKTYLDQYNRWMLSYSAPLILFLGLNALTIVPFLLFGTMALFLNYWYPFDPYQLHTFPYAYVWVMWAAYTALINMLATDSNLYSIITILSMEFDILNTDLKNILKTPKDKRVKKMQELIDHHNHLLDLSDRLQDIYSVTFLFSFFISSLILCFVVFQISQSSNPATIAFFFSYFGMMGGPIMLLCLYGQKLINSSASITEGIYESDWETFDDNDFKKQIILVTLRAQRFKQLTAMKFSNVSLESLTAVNILKVARSYKFNYCLHLTQVLFTTGSYFSLLRSVYVKDG